MEMKRLSLLAAVCGCSAVAGGPTGSWDLGALAGYGGRYDWHRASGGGKKALLRAGCYLPGAGSEAGFETAFLGGMAVGRAWSHRLYELGIDYVRTKSPNERTRSSLYVARAAVGKPVGASFPRRGAYALGGVDFVVEDAFDTVLKESKTYWSVDLDLGLGLRMGKLDLRASYIVMLTTDNVPGALTFSAGLLF